MPFISGVLASYTAEIHIKNSSVTTWPCDEFLITQRFDSTGLIFTEKTQDKWPVSGLNKHKIAILLTDSNNLNEWVTKCYTTSQPLFLWLDMIIVAHIAE